MSLNFAGLQCPTCKKEGCIQLRPWCISRTSGMTGVSALCVSGDCEYMGIFDLSKPTFTIEVGE